eukprot:5060145-Prymnesium_polylepis.2
MQREAQGAALRTTIHVFHSTHYRRLNFDQFDSTGECRTLATLCHTLNSTNVHRPAPPSCTRYRAPKLLGGACRVAARHRSGHCGAPQRLVYTWYVQEWHNSGAHSPT